MERAPLMRNLDPLCRQALLVEEQLGLLQILLRENAHADALRLRLAARLFENKAVMARLGDPTQKQRIRVLVADNESEEIDVELPARRQILYGKHAMARARDVEGRIGDGLRDAHGALRQGFGWRAGHI